MTVPAPPSNNIKMQVVQKRIKRVNENIKEEAGYIKERFRSSRASAKTCLMFYGNTVKMTIRIARKVGSYS